MKNESVVAISLHQAVRFDGQLVTNFTDMNTRYKHRAKMTIVPELSCMLIESESDRALVPFVNIAYIKLDSKSHQEQQQFAEKEATKTSTLKSSDIKRPK